MTKPSPIINQDEAMVCVRRGCEVIYSGSLECPRCGFLGVHYREVEMLALGSPASALPLTLTDQPVLTRMIQ